MASIEPVKRSKPHPPPPPRPHKHAPNAYVARILSVAEIWRVVQGGLGPDAAITWVAERQLALITTPQLHAAGVRRGSIEWRLASGTLHPRHRGVYLVGHGIAPPGAIELAGVLACGERAFVSHRSAAALFGLVAVSGQGVDVTVARRRCRSRDGLRVHRVESLSREDRSDRRGIPVTAPARTLIDFASTTGAEEAERAIAEALALKLVTEPQLRSAIERAPGRAGVARVQTIIGQPGGPKRTRSGGERAMLRLIRAAQLPTPRTNYPVAGYSADFCWPDQHLIVELDGFDFHSGRGALERDHRRDIVHKNAGYEVLRFTARQLAEEPLLVITTIARALDRRTRG
jgi:very-short-patch-repair endonuclease/predicted transcriptional regulator of viral defense system